MSDDSKLRLLLCGECKSIEELPWYEGDVRGDHLLDYLASRHQYPDGNRHRGGALFDVPEKHWKDPNARQMIIEQINARTGKGLGDKFYEVKATFKEDAFTCWKSRNRTKNCGDFKSEKKRLIPDTKAERKDLGLSPVKSNRFLCEFCPYFSIAMQRMRAGRGDYSFKD
ncbi:MULTISPECIES: hypothetical protein [Streptosporangium]|uniref:Uncharacterized protein n=1 Tax=Streptosporangium brasiliense TaxID=47480 RepID=A0ABT9RMB6_9ACTN|nr:hypothetical protein [Streptosporangium brasiliense]MDP9870405.1 hypothetical protein [Streptosporangium brasiliense]